MAERTEVRAERLRAARMRVHAWTLVALCSGLPLAAASFYAAGTLPSGELPAFFAIGLSFGGIAAVTFFHGLRDALVAVRALEKGAMGREPLVAAALAVIKAPRRVRWVALRHLGAAVVLCLLAWRLLVPGFTGDTVVRVALTAACTVAVAAFLCELAVQTAGRRLLQEVIASGLALTEAATLVREFVGTLRGFLIELVALFALTGATLVSQAVLLRPAGEGLGIGSWLIVAIAATLACVAAAIAAHALSGPMREISARAQGISEGQVQERPLIAAEREVFMMAVAGAQLERQLMDAVQKLAVASQRLTRTTGGLVGTLGGQEQGSAEQASALNETSATTEELARSAGQIAENAAEVASVAERTVGAAQSGQRGSEAFFNAMIGMRTQNGKVADAVIRLNKRVQQIGKIVEFIHEIADKSDLLALNAELEGTKAGEVGRGFSLVAAEMRRVAEDVLRSTREIERLITDIRDATNAAVMATEAGVKATEGGTSAANEVMERLRVILEHARETSQSVRAISMATQQQQSGTRQLAEAMADILRVTEEGALATQQLHGANVDLSGLAESLQAVVSRFEVKGA